MALAAQASFSKSRWPISGANWIPALSSFLWTGRSSPSEDLVRSLVTVLMFLLTSGIQVSRNTELARFSLTPKAILLST